MMFQHLLAALAQHLQRDAEAAIRRFRAGNGLKQQIDRRAALQRGELRGDVREAARSASAPRSASMSRSSARRIAPTVSTESDAGFTPITASPHP